MLIVKNLTLKKSRSPIKYTRKNKNFEAFMSAALLGCAPGVFVGLCTDYLLSRNEHERLSIIDQNAKKLCELEKLWVDVHSAEKEVGIIMRKVAMIERIGHAIPAFKCEHDENANAPNSEECKKQKKVINDYVIEREQELSAHFQTVGWRTAEFITLAVASFFLSLRLAPSIVTASQSMHRTYKICVAGSILAGLVIPHICRL